MKREELKAYEGKSIYRVLECNPHNDDEQHLEKIFNDKSDFKFYEKDEANKVFDDYEKRITELEEDYRKISEMYIAEQTKAAKYEQRINELEKDNADLRAALDIDPRCGTTPKDLCNKIKELESQLENVQASMYADNVDANMALVKANERIKELETENERLRMANVDNLAHFDTLKEDYEELKRRTDNAY